jgi:DNA-binding transcriptional ArsR family regulator
VTTRSWSDIVRPVHEGPPEPTDTCDDDNHAVARKVRAYAPQTLTRAAGFFRAAGEVERLRLLGHLLEGEWCVSELAAALGEGMSTVSQRLRVLRAEGLLARRRDGKHVYYALADDHVAKLIESALAHAAEDEEKEG